MERDDAASRELERAKQLGNALCQLALTVVDTVASKDRDSIASPDQVAQFVSHWRDRSLAILNQRFSAADVGLTEGEWNLLKREIEFRSGELASIVRRRLPTEKPRPESDETLADLASLRQAQLEDLASVEDKGKRRLALGEFARAVLDFGASRAIARVQVEDDIAIFLEKVKQILMAPFWIDMELAGVALDGDDLAVIQAKVQSRLLYWEREAARRLKTEGLPDDDRQHNLRVEKVARHYISHGDGDKPPYCEFYEPLGVTASEFSNWKRGMWSKCGREKKRALDRAADALA